MSTLTASLVSSISGAPLITAPSKKASEAAKKGVVVVAKGEKISTKTPFGPSGDSKFKKDASGKESKGRGTYQFSKKYGANVDGYSPIYDPKEWSAQGDVYEGGPSGLTLWAITFGAVLVVGVLLIFNTSSLAN